MFRKFQLYDLATKANVHVCAHTHTNIEFSSSVVDCSF